MEKRTWILKGACETELKFNGLVGILAFESPMCSLNDFPGQVIRYSVECDRERQYNLT